MIRTGLYGLFSLLVVLFSTSCVSTGRTAFIAKQKVGTYYKKGVSAQCGSFVGYCMEKAGKNIPANPDKAINWLKWGTPVPWALKKPGDVIITWRNSPSSGDGHILIYIGDGKAVHRSTKNKPVGTIDVDRYRPRLLGVRRG